MYICMYIQPTSQQLYIVIYFYVTTSVNKQGSLTFVWLRGMKRCDILFERAHMDRLKPFDTYTYMYVHSYYYNTYSIQSRTKKLGHPKKICYFIYSTKYSSYKIDLISLDSPIQELSTSTTGRTLGFLLQLQLNEIFENSIAR